MHPPNTVISIWTDPRVLEQAQDAAVLAKISRSAVLRAALAYGLRELAARPEELRVLAGRSHRYRDPTP